MKHPSPVSGSGAGGAASSSLRASPRFSAFTPLASIIRNPLHGPLLPSAEPNVRNGSI
jgi:hypothetical protein